MMVADQPQQHAAKTRRSALSACILYLFSPYPRGSSYLGTGGTDPNTLLAVSPGGANIGIEVEEDAQGGAGGGNGVGVVQQH